MKSIKSLAGLAAAAMLTVGLMAQTPTTTETESKGRHHGMRKGGGFERMTQSLNLTDAQKQQVQEMQRKQFESTKDLRTEIRSLHEQTAAAKQANDTAKLESLSQQRKELMTKMQTAMEKSNAELRALLTPEQQAKFDQMRSEFKNRRKSGENKHNQ